jgi:hypothetical protein
VLDRLTPKSNVKPSQFTQLFNLGTDSTAELQVLAPQTAAVEKLVGRRKPMVGWRAERFGGDLQPSPAIAVRTASAVIASVSDSRPNADEGWIDHILQ